MKCTMKDVGLTRAFDIDGKTLFPSAYMSYAPLQEDFDDMKAHGVNLFMFGIYAGDQGINMESGLRPFSDNFFKGYEEYDFSCVEKIMTMIAPTGKEEVYVIPRVCVEPPKWWQKLNPEEVGCDYSGEPLRYCYTSQKWREDMMAAVRALIDYFEASKWKNTVIGYHIACGGTEEWTYQCRYADSYYEYSQRNLQAYRAWLEAKYGSCQALSRAWGREIPELAAVQFPDPVSTVYARRGFLRNPAGERDILDYFDFYNGAVADTIGYFCRGIKEYTGYSRVTGAFYGYVAVLPQNYKGTHALGKLLEDPHIDFLSTTNWYKDPGGAWFFASAVRSAQLHGKMWIAEGDLRTSKATNMGVYLPHALPDNDYYTSRAWQPLASMEASESVLTKGLARILTAKCGIWWFGMFGRWFSDARMMRIIEKTAPLLAKQQKNHLKADVAFLIDEGSYKYYGIPGSTLRDVMVENTSRISHAGFAYDNYLLSDIKKDSFPAEDYRLFIIVGAVDPSPEDRAAIEKKLKRGNKTLLWLHSSGYYDSTLSGFSLVERSTDKTEPVEFNRQLSCDLGEAYTEREYSLPSFAFADAEGFVLARFAGSREPAVKWKNFPGYSSVFSLTMAPSTALYRHIAVLSGVHIYNFTGDCIYAGGEFTGIHAVEGGFRRISLPHRGFTAVNAVTGAAVPVNECFIDLSMEKHETVLLHITKE